MCTHMIVINTLTVIRKHFCRLMLSVKIFCVLYLTSMQTVWIQIRLFPMEQSDLGPNYLLIETSTIQWQLTTYLFILSGKNAAKISSAASSHFNSMLVVTSMQTVWIQIWPPGYKTFFMPNSTEHKSSTAHKN